MTAMAIQHIGRTRAAVTATGDYLAELRTSRNLSKYAVASSSGISHANLFRYEHGQRFPSADVIARLNRSYALTTDEADFLMRCIADDVLTPYAAAVQR